MEEETLKQKCDDLREQIYMLAERIRLLMKHPEVSPAPTAESFGLAIATEALGEMRANIMLAYRHLEDARMRIGKVLQAQDGGVSVYDKPDTEPYYIDFNGRLLRWYGKGMNCEQAVDLEFPNKNPNDYRVIFAKSENGIDTIKEMKVGDGSFKLINGMIITVEKKAV